MGEGKAAFGTTLSRDGNNIAELTNIEGPSLSATWKEVTTHDSADGYREFVQATREGGSVTIEGNFYPGDTTGQAGLITDLAQGTVQSFLITFPSATGATWAFSGVVGSLQTLAPHDGKMGFKATLKISGKPVFGMSASAGLTTPFFSISDSATITPSAAGGVYTYVANVATGVSSVTVTPTATAGTITVNGETVTSGQPSSSITLGAAGSVTEITIVVTESGKSPKTYDVRLARAAS
jgi:hypothetical protein